MEAQYDIQAIMRDLQATSELHPDQHDGSYELMRQTIQQYSRMADDSAWDYKDLNLVYLTTVGTWKQGLDGKLKTVQESHLPEESKAALASLWNSIWENAVAGKYSNSGMDASGKPSIGMFGTGFYSFQNKTTTGHVKAFIHMCVDILGLSDDNAMFDRAAPVLTASFQGMRSASASMILHCLKPFSFPVLNSNMGNYNIFEVLGVQLTKRDNIETYIDNCRKIKEFRDSNFSFKNYRVFDMAAWKVGEYSISEDKDKKAWLVTWNQNNWQWEDYREKCAGTKKGESFVESWACASSSPKQGDEVFLIKLGEQPRGIIGHGTVVRESYEKDHYDPAKAAAGKKEKCIDVEFDRVQNYQTEKFIGQNVLQQECSDQHWSPQGSGIEIKPQVLPKLAALWQAITESDTDQWRPSLAEYDPGFTSADYKSFFLNPGVVKPEWLTSLYQMYLMPGHLATCKQLAERYGSTPSHYISFLSSTASRIAKSSGCPLLPGNRENTYWPILFQGRNPEDREQGTFIWKMRPNVVEAMEEIITEGYFEGSERPVIAFESKNMILYGPPGTGKTYNSVIYAVSICDGVSLEDTKARPYNEVLDRYRELKDEGRIVFTTFHQSYGYEEFIEGIKPTLDGESGGITYSVIDGVFKSFCKQAGAIKVQEPENYGIKEMPRIWGMLLGGTGVSDLKKHCFSENEIRLGWAEVDDAEVEGDFSGDSNSSWNAKHMVYDFIYSMEVGDIVIIEKSAKTIDAIGVITGDYEKDGAIERYPRKRNVRWLAKGIEQDVIPYLPDGQKQMSRYSLFAFDKLGMDAVFEIIKKQAGGSTFEVKQESKPYVFVIDEINRGNISKIFGELITLIEKTKRHGAAEAMEAVLPYSGDTFSVPQNVYILGTMNTADRSIALMDTALRRRFEFIEMMPDAEVLESMGVGIIEIDGEELNIAKMLETINHRIEYLFDREHTIGHAFFTKLADDTSIEMLASIFERNVIPLLQEYFYEDYEKIQLVLGDNGKEDQYKFILDQEIKVRDVFNGTPDVDLPEVSYSIQHEAFFRIQSYKQIGKGL